jgi:hypothetical protein
MKLNSTLHRLGQAVALVVFSISAASAQYAGPRWQQAAPPRAGSSYGRPVARRCIQVPGYSYNAYGYVSYVPAHTLCGLPAPQPLRPAWPQPPAVRPPAYPSYPSASAYGSQMAAARAPAPPLRWQPPARPQAEYPMQTTALQPSTSPAIYRSPAPEAAPSPNTPQSTASPQPAQPQISAMDAVKGINAAAGFVNSMQTLSKLVDGIMDMMGDIVDALF